MLKSELEDALFVAEAKAAVSQTVEDTLIVNIHDLECSFCKESYNIQYRVVLGETEFWFCDGCIDDFVSVLVALGYKYDVFSRNKKFRAI